MTETEISKLIDFFNKVEKLKVQQRYGSSAIQYQESVADHSFKVALMSIFTAKLLNLNYHNPKGCGFC